MDRDLLLKFFPPPQLTEQTFCSLRKHGLRLLDLKEGQQYFLATTILPSDKARGFYSLIAVIFDGTVYDHGALLFKERSQGYILKQSMMDYGHKWVVLDGR
jgi:hypothetical protein